MTLSWWLAVGFLGQALFSARFVVQWIASERAKRSVVPVAFWFLSLAGGVTLLVYAIHRRDPVFMLGQGAGLFIYLRNLTLLRGNRFCSSGLRQQETSQASIKSTSSRAGG
ncbi:lipid-A-disaccharide synthase N-terminal domain-containing protein [Halomonas sp. DP5N14-9]|uniref:Lipid-A-disaccharide synthase N-terminal domain-containing protein n=1 Tax=Halomonas sp. H10-59 TaxID=2950874 RepID=A0AAU7KXN6_9GAMM|nr:lipid-A-disaccharide synthase N-terminal domain-containing protein [Halomonas sp. DP5N14-9]MBY5940203.1 lipid-A-disaccharide synthase N-terminal domain-containing protein [Halomonas sp. DP5N14-9]